MDENCPNSSNFRSLEGSENSIFQKSPANSPALKLSIDGQAPNHHQGHGVRHISLHTARRIQVSRRTRGERVITHNTTSNAHHVRPGSAAIFIMIRSEFEPRIKFGLAALKLGEIMVC